jgi:hypothetical protein
MVLTTKKDDKWLIYTLLNGAFYDGFFLKGDGKGLSFYKEFC